MKVPPSIKSSWLTSCFTFSLCLGPLATAYMLVCLTQIAPVIKLRHKLTPQQLVWQLTLSTSVFNLGNIVGIILPIFLGPVIYQLWFLNLTQKYGVTIRQKLIVIDLLCIVFIAYYLIDMDFIDIVICRLALGFIIGISSSLVPKYIRMVSPMQIAGTMGTINQLMQTLGVLFTCLFGFYVIQPHQDDQIIWRLYLGFPLFIVLLRAILLFKVFPYDSKNPAQLKKFVQKTYSTDKDIALQNLKSQFQNKTIMNIKKDGLVKQSSKYNKSYNKRFKLGLLLMASNQITGINSILMYSKQLISKIFTSTNQNKYMLQAIMCFIGLLQILSTLWATFIIEKQGRKKMIINGQAQIIFILVSIYIVDHFARPFISDNIVNYIVVGLILLHIVVHNRGLGSICIVYCADILDDLSWMIIMLKICSFMVAFTSQYMIQYLGFSNMFLIFAVFSSIAHIFIRDLVIQTKNVSKQQIYAKFQSKQKQ